MLEILGCTLGNGVNFSADSGLALLPTITRTLITIIKIGIPIILIFFGMLDLGKAVMSNDEKVMKESQGKLIKRIIYAVLVFLIVAIVQLLVGVLNGAGANEDDSVAGCIDCFIVDKNACE